MGGGAGLKYLYGDATESPLDRNYLEFLRAALAFSVALLQNVDAVRQLRRTGKRRRSHAAKELEQLRMVAKRIANALGQGADLDALPVAKGVVYALRELTIAQLHKAESKVRGSLETELEQLESAIRRKGGENLELLEKLLLRYDLPESRQWVDVRMQEDGSYAAQLVGNATSDAGWVLALDIPADHLLGQPLRIDRLLPDLAIQVPEMSGWVRKSVKLRTYKIAKEYVVDVTHHESRVMMHLRASVQDRENGFDITYEAPGKPVSITRLSKGTASDPFDPEPEDVGSLRELFVEVAKATAGLVGNRRALLSAQLDDMPLEEHEQPEILIERLVAQMAPVVREISDHSLSPAELVLKRVLADDRREEIFASKADLREMLGPLSDLDRAVFQPLDLGVPKKRAEPSKRSASSGPSASAKPSKPAAAEPQPSPAPAVDPALAAPPLPEIEVPADTSRADPRQADPPPAPAASEPPGLAATDPTAGAIPSTPGSSPSARPSAPGSSPGAAPPAPPSSRSALPRPSQPPKRRPRTTLPGSPPPAQPPPREEMPSVDISFDDFDE